MACAVQRDQAGKAAFRKDVDSESSESSVRRGALEIIREIVRPTFCLPGADVEKAVLSKAKKVAFLAERSEPLLPVNREGPPKAARGFSFCQATLTMFNCMVGGSVLALPYAIARAGLFGFVVLGLVACVMGITASLIGKNLSIIAEHPMGKEVPPSGHDWALVGRVCFGPWGKTFMTCLFLFDLSTCLVNFLIASGINLPLAFPTLLTPVSGIIVAGIAAFFLLYVPIRFFPYFSLFGIVAQIVLFVNLLTTGAAVAEAEPDLFAKDFKFIDAAALPSMLGLFIGCFQVHSITPTIYQNVEDKSQWCGIALLSSMLACTFYAIVAFVGYATFGNNASQAFTANLGRNMMGELLPGMEFMPPLSGALVATNILVTVPAMSRPIFAFVEARGSFAKGWVGGMLVKIVVTMALTSLAVLGRSLLPYVIAVRGAVIQVLIAIVLPQLAFIVLRWDSLSTARRVGLLLLAASLYLVTVPGAIEDIHKIAVTR